MRKSTQQRGKETTQLANIQEDDANKETPRSGNHKAWMTETKRILVRNIGNSAKRDIETLFARFGPLTEIKIPINRLTKRQVGFAFVTFKMAKHAATATSTLNGKGFQGRTLELTIRDLPRPQCPPNQAYCTAGEALLTLFAGLWARARAFHQKCKKKITWSYGFEARL